VCNGYAATHPRDNRRRSLEKIRVKKRGVERAIEVAGNGGIEKVSGGAGLIKEREAGPVIVAGRVIGEAWVTERGPAVVGPEQYAIMMPPESASAA
jgi:hypothetical protein